MTKPYKNTITIMLANGHFPRDLMQKLAKIVEKYNLEIYLSSVQNLRITGMRDEDIDQIKALLIEENLTIKKPGNFPKPRTCVGKTFCKMGHADTHKLCEQILCHFKTMRPLKGKLKIAIAGCERNCSNPKLADIGIVATAKGGYNVYAGGKGGGQPIVGKKIAKNINKDEVIKTIDTLINFHDIKTKTKQRLCKLIEMPDFPYTILN